MYIVGHFALPWAVLYTCISSRRVTHIPISPSPIPHPPSTPPPPMVQQSLCRMGGCTKQYQLLQYTQQSEYVYSGMYIYYLLTLLPLPIIPITIYTGQGKSGGLGGAVRCGGAVLNSPRKSTPPLVQTQRTMSHKLSLSIAERTGTIYIPTQYQHTHIYTTCQYLSTIHHMIWYTSMQVYTLYTDSTQVQCTSSILPLLISPQKLHTCVGSWGGLVYSYSIYIVYGLSQINIFFFSIYLIYLDLCHSSKMLLIYMQQYSTYTNIYTSIKTNMQQVVQPDYILTDCMLS